MSAINGLLRNSHKLGADFMDARVQESQLTSLTVTNGEVEEVQTTRLYGIGIRVLVDGSWAFASFSKIPGFYHLKDIKDMIASARELASHSKNFPGKVSSLPTISKSINLQAHPPIAETNLGERITLLEELRSEIVSLSRKVIRISFDYEDSSNNFRVMNSLGTQIDIQNDKVKVIVSIRAKNEGKFAEAVCVIGGYGGLNILSNDRCIEAVRNTGEQACRLLGAKKTPEGKFDVVLDPELVGGFAHEAVGHFCEADLTFPMKTPKRKHPVLGQQLLQTGITIVDDATIQGELGSMPFDDEGTPGQRNVIVDKGRLQSLLHSLETFAEKGERPTGNARAKDYRYPPIARMTNTYLAPADWKTDEMFSETKRGLYLKGPAYGEINPFTGSFTIKCEEAWMIKEGEAERFCRGVLMEGNAFDVFNRIDAIGNDVKLYPSVCRKSGQEIDVTVGGPHVRVRKQFVAP